jgi:DNA polymerase-3 subunit epsilon
MIPMHQKLINAFKKHGVHRETIHELMHEELIEDEELFLELVALQGLKLAQKNELFYFDTVFSSIEDTTFCIVDIECNGSKNSRDQIIEIGALLYKNGTVIDSFSSLIYSNYLPKTISELTGITLDDLKDAPKLVDVMQDFRLFLGDAVFVAHALKFDYEFVSAMFIKTGLGRMLNRALCTIDLAERTISSAKYGLNYLNETLHLEEDLQAHRAFNDAKLTAKLFEILLLELPSYIHTAEELISFSKNARRMPKAALIKEES